VFTTVRLREGYDLAQVDTFLDQVEATLATILRENTELKARLDGYRQTSQPGESAPRIVALAQETASRAIDMARQDAGRIVEDAREEAETTSRDALCYAIRLREGLERQMRQLTALLAELHDETARSPDSPR
jgi:DivIVA domain-containing protein